MHIKKHYKRLKTLGMALLNKVAFICVLNMLFACKKISMQLMFSLESRLFMIITPTDLCPLSNTRCWAYGFTMSLRGFILYQV